MGKKQETRKFSFLAGEYDTGKLLNSDAPVIGARAAEIQAEQETKKQKETQKKEEEQQRQKKEGRAYVAHGAKLKCPECTKPEGILKVLENRPKLQHKLWTNISDNKKEIKDLDEVEYVSFKIYTWGYNPNNGINEYGNSSSQALLKKRRISTKSFKSNFYGYIEAN